MVTAALVALVASSQAPAAVSSRAWTVRDSVQTTYFYGDQFDVWSGVARGDFIVPSPDRERFFFVRWHGDIDCDCNVFELQVFDTAQVAAALSSRSRTPPAPLGQITLRSSSNAPAISSARWVNDSKAIAFLGAENEAEPQIYHFDLGTGRMSVLTHQPLGVKAFDMRSGSTLYLAMTSRKQQNQLDRYPVNVVDATGLGAAFGLTEKFSWNVFSIFGDGGTPQQVGDDYHTPALINRFWVSPDGRWAHLLRPIAAARAPAHWDDYESVAPGASASGGTRLAGTARNDFFQFMLLDMRSGEWRPAVDAPTGLAVGNAVSADVLWSPDSERAILVNTTLSLEGGAPERRQSAYVAELNLTTGSVEPVFTLSGSWVEGGHASRHLSRIAWKVPGKELLATFHGTAGGLTSVVDEARVYSRRGLVWHSTSARAADLRPGSPLAHGISVAVRQDANAPPRAFASDSQREIALSSTDAHVSEARFAEVMTVQWHDSAHRVWAGGLMLPEAANPSRPVPLVIQAGGYEPNRFLPDGRSLTADAAQPLVSRGMAVLFLRHHDVHGYGSPMEAPSFVDGVDSAIEQLSARFPLDRNRIGLVGFSRTGFLTNYAVSHPGRNRIAAAVSADWGDPSYLQYVTWSLMPLTASIVPQYEAIHGAGTFWQNKEAWLTNAPGFNADRVRTPMLLTLNGKHNVPTATEFYAALRLNGKPAELLLFPEGEHQLKRPRERLASLHATVDWMSFWLLDYVDTDSAKQEQYARWRALRRQHEGASK